MSASGPSGPLVYVNLQHSSCKQLFSVLILIIWLHHANQTSVSWSRSELRVRLAPWNRFKPSSKIFLLTLLLWIICVINVLCSSCFCVCSLLPCGQLLGKGWPLGSCMWYLLLLSHVVSWVRCGTWLYRFLIFAAFLTFIIQCFHKRINPGSAWQGLGKKHWFMVICLLDLIWFFTPQSTNFQICRDGSSWVEPVLSKD